MSVMKAGAQRQTHLEAWLATGQKKICVKGDDADHLTRIEEQAKQHTVLTTRVHDAGHTQIPSGLFTILALGPAMESDLEAITGSLKLL
jgi:PTH2 family peptidyl-tRNA hydrolase